VDTIQGELFETTEPEVVEEVEEPKVGTISVPVELIQLIRSAPSGEAILNTAIDLVDFLCRKNLSYGNSALSPIRIFSSADPLEQIKIRMDDKLNRIAHGAEFEDDNDYQDLLGYLLLYFVARREHERGSEED
jgi:hypothetical protein